MGDFFHGIFQFFFLTGYIILFIVSIIILRPFRVHKRRRFSTISIKVSYLIFLLLFLIFTYLLLFGTKRYDKAAKPYESIFNFYFIFLLSATIVPNLGIMVRKRIKKKRIEYNLIFSGVNILYSFYMLFLILTGKWALL
jgi:hypothetical protein